MKKRTIMLILLASVMILGINIACAQDSVTNEIKGSVETKQASVQEMPCKKFDGPPPFEMKGPHHKKFHHERPSKEEMEKKRIEFEKRLGLTDEQKKQIELQKQADREKIKPVIDDIRVKKQEFRTIKTDDNLTAKEKDKKLKATKEDLRKLKIKADSLRKENMQNFENILTDEQKQEFSKIKEEQRKEMKERKKAFPPHKFPHKK